MIIQALIAEKINQESIMFQGKASYAFSMNQFATSYAAVAPPFCIVTINGERVAYNQLKRPTVNISEHPFGMERRAVISCFLPIDAKTKVLQSENLETARADLIKCLGGWQPTDCHYATLYEGYAIREDDEGAAWVDFYFDVTESLNYVSFQGPQEPLEQLKTKVNI
jgi:hypothetical protein